MNQSVNKFPATPSELKMKEVQRHLDLVIDKQTEIQGIGMGVLSDGTPFLNQRGLARLCGIENAHIGTISSQWSSEPEKPRIAAIKRLVERHGDVPDQAHIECKNGQSVMFAYTDNICISILEYYAFDAGVNCKEEARENFRLLAGRALKEFIYTQVGYDPDNKIPEVWQQFHDRVSLVHDSVPDGYFSIFKEMSDIIVTLISGGAKVGPDFVPDISMGTAWAKHWKDIDGDNTIGTRMKFLHEYPDSFPQSESNPQLTWCYPDEALPEFRRWSRSTYIKKALPKYLKSKEQQGSLPPSVSQLAIQALENRGSGKPVIEG